MESHRPGCQRTLHKRWQQQSRYWAAAGNRSRRMKNFGGTVTRSPSGGHTHRSTSVLLLRPDRWPHVCMQTQNLLTTWNNCSAPWSHEFRGGGVVHNWVSFKLHHDAFCSVKSKSPSGYCKVVKTKRTCQIQEPWCFVKLMFAGMKYCSSMVA